MRAVVELEFIAENYFNYLQRLRRGEIGRHPGTERYADLLGRDKARPWVARLISYDDERCTFERQFMNGQIDYSRANREGSRGVYLYYVLTDGLYEVNERTSWHKVRRYFLRIEGMQKTEISREEVEQCLRNRS